MSFKDKPFIRVFELRLSRNGVPFLALQADGSRDNLHIAFSVNKTLVSTPNEAKITIYNMQPDTRKILMQPNIQAELFVGWKNIQPVRLAYGDVVLAMPTKEIPNNQMALSLFDGYRGISDSTIYSSYLRDTAIQEVIFDMASSIAGINVDGNKINVGGIVGSKGYVITGRVFTELNKLANSYNFSWSIQNNIFQAFQSGRSSQNKHVIASENLFSAIPQLQDPSQLTAAQIQIGMEIRAFIQPAIIPGDIVVLNSEFVPMYNGDYVVHNIDFDGDSNGNVNEMKIESKKFGI